MLRLTVRQSPTLLEHLKSHEIDGATVAGVLFEGGRLQYPGRQQVEQLLQESDPYTLELESRVVDGFYSSIEAAIRFLAKEATACVAFEEPTLDLLWGSHNAYRPPPREGPSLDRLIAALCMVERARSIGDDREVDHAAAILIRGLNSAGFPASVAALDEIWEDAPPACVGLGIVRIG